MPDPLPPLLQVPLPEPAMYYDADEVVLPLADYKWKTALYELKWRRIAGVSMMRVYVCINPEEV